MNADAELPEAESSEDETLARHTRMAEVLGGERRMGWADWKDMSIYESTCLTADGQRVSLWAVDVLQRVLKDDFLSRVEDWQKRMQEKNPDVKLEMHPIFSLGFWPANDVPWVYANLIRLAANIQLFILENKSHPNKVRDVVKALHDNLEPISWVSALLQLEVAGLGRKAGWQVQFEPQYLTGKKSDVRLTNGPTHLLVETTLMRRSVQERKALAFFDRLAWHLDQLGWQYDVRISGSLKGASSENAEAVVQWLQAIEEVARATSHDGQVRLVPGPAEMHVEVFRPTEATVGEPWGVEGDPIETYPLNRLLTLLQDKNSQAEGSVTPVWVRLNETAGLWQCTRFQGMTLTQMLTFLTDFLQENFLSLFPNLAGVILSTGALWAGGAPLDALGERATYNGSIALRNSVPVDHCRETIIIPRPEVPNSDAEVFADWYIHEDTWLDWALNELGHPSFNALSQEPLTENGL